ncbi:MAG: 16S rRNA (guanine(966)-N(2))-methyltransferase RsmD [Salinarimonadaceae bacterium]|nr:MAG: 16S rRNA (guanine(966)-N(2))-methyltransferase RsmD [Salinarimonadaceae bacterium]
MRIVGGRLRGRAIAGPTGGEIRPTSDRLREAVFNILAHGHDDACDGARVIDLFAGTGAMGIEALSRGAVFAAFVDEGAQARGLIRENVEALGLGGVTRILRRDATRLGQADRFEPADLVFCDPPYGKNLAPRALRSCAEGGWLNDGALVVVEEDAEAKFAMPEGFEEVDRRAYGGTLFIFARYRALGRES